MESNNKATSKLLIYLRRKHNLTQKDIAVRFDVSSQAVSKWERAENLPDSKILLVLARFYGITVDELLVGEITIQRNHEISNYRKNYLTIFAASSVLIGLFLRIELYKIDHLISSISSLILLSMGLVSFITISSNKKIDATYLNKNQKVVFSTTIFIYFCVNYIFEIWEISWIVFVLSYALVVRLESKE